MILTIIRGLFVLLMAAAGYSIVTSDFSKIPVLGGQNWLAMSFCLTLAILIISIDILAGRRKLAVFSGIAFGVLVGITITYALSFGVLLLIDNVVLPGGQGSATNRAIANSLNLILGCVSCYFAISFILQTKDDFRFIIPYVEFRRDTRGAKPIVVDTSALIDGRLREVAKAGFLDSRLVVPQFVVGELQILADSADAEKRQKGRRGLDVLGELREDLAVDVRLFDDHQASDTPVDQHLVELARQLDAKLLTVDFNLTKVAALSEVSTLNLNDLAQCLHHHVRAGDEFDLRIERTGTGENQGVGRLEDGTMVVVENAADLVGTEARVAVKNTTQTTAGRMVFARLTSEVVDDASSNKPRRRRAGRVKRGLSNAASSVG